MEYTYNQQEITDKVFNFIYDCAMHDAVLQRSFSGEKTWVGKVSMPKKRVRDYIDKVLKNEFISEDYHNKVFLDTANAVCKDINNAREQDQKTDIFSFGNAQKLINMTVKHIYSFCYHNPALREGFRYCHCPLDSIMLDKVWKQCEEQYGGKGQRSDKLGKCEEFLKPWGNEGTEGKEQPELFVFPERYSLFQSAVKDLIGKGDIFPIEFDYIEWKQL